MFHLLQSLVNIHLKILEEKLSDHDFADLCSVLCPQTVQVIYNSYSCLFHR